MKRFNEQEVSDIHLAIKDIKQSIIHLHKLHRMELVKDALFQSIDRLNGFLKENKGDKNGK